MVWIWWSHLEAIESYCVYNTIVDDAYAYAYAGNSDTYVSHRYAGETKTKDIQNLLLQGYDFGA